MFARELVKGKTHCVSKYSVLVLSVRLRLVCKTVLIINPGKLYGDLITALHKSEHQLNSTDITQGQYSDKTSQSLKINNVINTHARVFEKQR